MEVFPDDPCKYQPRTLSYPLVELPSENVAPHPFSAIFVDDNPKHGDGFLPLKPALSLTAENWRRSQHNRAYMPPSFDDEATKNENREETEGICNRNRSIKWMDQHGRDLIEVKEFETSDWEDTEDENEDDGDEHGDFLTLCACIIQ